MNGNSLNTINFYLELNDNMSSKLTSLKGEFKNAFDDVAKIAEQMVTSVENAFASINLKGLQKQLSTEITKLRKNMSRRAPIKIPATVDFTGALTGTALGVALGHAMAGLAKKLPEQSIAATLKPRLGKRTVTIAAMKELRTRVVDWFAREENAIPLRFSTKANKGLQFGGKGGIKALRDNITAAIGAIELNFAPEIAKFETGLTEAIQTSVGPALMEASEAAASVFVNTIMGALAMTAHGPPTGPAGSLQHAEFGFPGGMGSRQAAAAQRLIGEMDPANFQKAIAAVRAEEDPEKHAQTFARVMSGRKSVSGQYIEQATLKLQELGDIGDVAGLKQMGRTPEEQQGPIANLFGFIARKAPGAAEGAEIPKSVDEVLIRAHGGEAILPYAKAEESIGRIIENALQRSVYSQKGFDLFPGLFAGKPQKIELTISPEAQLGFSQLQDALVKGTPAQVALLNDWVVAYKVENQKLNDLVAEQKDISWINDLEVFEEKLTAIAQLGDPADLQKAVDAQKIVVATYAEAVEKSRSIARTFSPQVEHEISALMGGGRPGWADVPGRPVFPGMSGGGAISPGAEKAALGMISARSVAQTGGEVFGDLDFREMQAALEAATEAGGNWVEIGNLINSTSKGVAGGTASVINALDAYRGIMSRANIETEAGARSFSTARTAVINLTKRLKQHQKVVEKGAGAYSNVNLELNELIDRSGATVDEMDALKRSQQDSANSSKSMSLNFRGLISEAKKLAPLMITIAGAKVSARVDTALMSTREQLVNNTDSWEQYRDIATDVMAHTGLSIEDVGKLMTVAAQRGFESREELRKFAFTVGTVAVAARGMGANVENATSMAAYNFQRLGIEVRDMDSAFSQLMRSSREGSLSMSDLNTVIGSNIEWLQVVGESSEKATLRMARFAGAAQVLSESFGTAAQGAGAVNELMQVVTALADPAQYGGPVAAEMTTLLQYAGVSFEELMATVQRRDFATVIQQLSHAMENIPLEQVNQFGTAIEGLIGISRESIMQIKMDPGITRRLEQTLAAIDMAGMSTDEMVDAMDRYNLGLDQATTIMKGQFTQAVDGAFGTVKDALVFIVQKVAKLLHAFNELPAPAKSLIGVLAAVGSLAMLAGLIGKVILSLQMVTTALKLQAGASLLGKGAGGGALAAGGKAFLPFGGAAFAASGKALLGAAKGLGVVSALVGGTLAYGSLLTDLFTGNWSKGATAGFAKALGMDELYKLFERESEFDERVRRHELTYAEYERRRLQHVANAQQDAADAMNDLTRELEKSDDPTRDAFESAIANRFDSMVALWRNSLEAGAETRPVTVMTGRTTGERREVPLREMQFGIESVASEVRRALALRDVDLTQREVVDQMRASLLARARVAELPETLTEANASQFAEQFAEEFVRNYLRTAAQDAPVEMGYERSNAEVAEAMALAMQGSLGILHREFSRSDMEAMAEAFSPGYVLPRFRDDPEQYGRMAEAMEDAMDALDTTSWELRELGALHPKYLQFMREFIQRERLLTQEAVLDIEPRAFLRTEDEQAEWERLNARYTQLRTEMGVIESLDFLSRPPPTDEEGAARHAEAMESIGRQLREAENAYRIATGEQASFEQRQEMFMRFAREWAEDTQFGITPEAQEFMNRLNAGFMSGMSDADLRANVERLLGEFGTPRSAVEQWYESLTGHDLAELLAEEQEEAEKRIIQGMQESDRRTFGKPEKPDTVVPTSDATTVQGKDERLVVVASSPEELSVLKAILGVLQETRDKERSEIRRKGNPFFNRAIMGMG